MRRALRCSLAVLLIAALAGCGGNNLDNARAGVPSTGAVTVNVPQKAGAVLGQLAPLYVLTYADTSIINLGVAAVLTILHDIVQNPPTSTSGSVYTWGPGAASPLDPNQWKLTVTDEGNGTYSYTLQGAQKGSTTFVTVISGTHTPVKTNGVNDPNHGSGTFLLDWNARATLALPDGNIGTANVTYAHPDASVKVDIAFTGIHNSQGAVVNANYHYNQPLNSDGTYQFSDQSNLDPATAALESLTIESRWDTTGAGRCDVNVTGGDLGTTMDQASECWDMSFDETYWFDNVGIQPAQGMESSCPGDFQTAVFYDGQ